MNSGAIKTMQLYNNIDRIKIEIERRGLTGDKINVNDLVAFTCLNYTGSNGCDNAIEFINLTSDSHMLDLGCGLGGPSLYIANKTGSKVTGIEVQPDLVEVSASLSKKCGLDSLFTPVCMNASNITFQETFDGMISMLTVLHIPLDERKKIFQAVYSSLKLEAGIYIEDFFKKGENFTIDEMKSLKDDVFCTDLPSFQEYKDLLISCGFVEVELIDKTEEWKDFVADRLAKFEENKEDYVKSFNEATYDSLHHFYQATNSLFQGGNLGGVCVRARKN